ncbi:DNA phosphorothioation-associated putative methyltransferase [Methylobacterium sp. 174MFSha1.1]|uniref:DNA phosphorothioation-associated putative methyltransferase n=1 Tax=Methylobacterium sp. 174MFSha1.1 TaxID=1502749 RepID=UPI0015A5A32A|nr:DNA phosphorothioation-associated putative methyltransferase [Methylobacterium sp. 174MFSha1.1]
MAKITPKGVTLLAYEDFDTAAFPRLRHAWRPRVDGVDHDDYTRRDNPPILHRKELLLRADDPRVELFADLTRQAVERGLFADPHRIGTANAWEKRLEDAGVVVIGHRLADRAAPVARHRTAIARNRLSTPMQQLVLQGFIADGVSVFDYGCGQGDDVRALQESGVEASGWDPYFAPAAARLEAEVVNLGFVLNVIETPGERIEVLRRAFSLARRVLAVSVMMTGQRPSDGLQTHGDGHLTSRGTFQKYFTQLELRELVAEALGRDPVAVAPGVVFAFRQAEDEQDFLERRQSRQRQWPTGIELGPSMRSIQVGVERSRFAPLVDDVATSWLELGRAPLRDEIPPSTSAALRDAGLSLERATRLAANLIGHDRLIASETSRREDLTLFLAMWKFGRRSGTSLSERLRRDVRHFFSSLSKAEEAGTAFLFSLGSLDTLAAAAAEAAEQKLGHRAGSFLHFRRDALDRMPLAIRGLVACVTVIHGGLDEVDVIAVDVGERRATLYRILDFDARLPLVTRSTKVSLPRQDLHDRIYEEGRRPIFLGRSRYAANGIEAVEREALETKIRRVLGMPEDRLTCRQDKLADVLRASGRRGSP